MLILLQPARDISILLPRVVTVSMLLLVAVVILVGALGILRVSRVLVRIVMLVVEGKVMIMREMMGGVSKVMICRGMATRGVRGSREEHNVIDACDS